MLRAFAILFFAVFLLGTVADATTVEDLPTRKLRNPKLIEIVRLTAAKAVALNWNEGSRSFLRYLSEAHDDLDIRRIKISKGVVQEMDVIVNVMVAEVNEGTERNYSAKCEVHMEKYDGVFDANYALCVTAEGEEIEYEH